MDGKIIYLLNRVLNERMQQLVGFTLAQSSVQHTNLTRHLILAFLVMLFVLMPAFKSLAADEIKIDHPLMSRYQGVNSTTFKQDIFDYIGLDLPVGKIDDRYGNDNVLHVAGKASFITYHLPKQTSQLEVVKTLKLQIKKSKFEVIFECAESDDFKHNSCGKQMYFFAHSKRAANGFQFNCGRKKEYYLVTAILKRADGKSSYLYICVEEGKLNQSIVEEKDFVPNKITIDTANYLPTTQSLTAVKALDKPDTKGAKDHPLISRFPGSYIERYAEIDFMTFNLPTKSLAYDEKLTSKHRLPVSGKGTFIQYHLPDGLSQYQVVENYRQAFEKNNIKILFQCQGEQECGDAFDNKTKDLVGGLKGNPDVAHDCGGGKSVFISAKMQHSPDHSSYIFLCFENSWQFTISQSIIEQKAMKTGLITLSVDEMSASIASKGKVAIYGILFDNDSATIKGDSAPILKQLSQLLNTQPTLKLYVVGHTDGQGNELYNQQLSKKRAQAVIDALTEDYGIAGTRLQARGVGELVPVSTNRAIEGRQLNRRVELVEM